MIGTWRVLKVSRERESTLWPYAVLDSAGKLRETFMTLSGARRYIKRQKRKRGKIDVRIPWWESPVVYSEDE